MRSKRLYSIIYYPRGAYRDPGAQELLNAVFMRTYESEYVDVEGGNTPMRFYGKMENFFDQIIPLFDGQADYEPGGRCMMLR